MSSAKVYVMIRTFQKNNSFFFLIFRMFKRLKNAFWSPLHKQKCDLVSLVLPYKAPYNLQLIIQKWYVDILKFVFLGGSDLIDRDLSEKNGTLGCPVKITPCSTIGKRIFGLFQASVQILSDIG